MQTPQTRLPPFPQMLGNGTLDFLHQSCSGDSDYATPFHESSEVAQVEIIRAVIHKGINAHDRVEELRREGQRARVRAHREHALFDTGISNSLEVLRVAEPQVGGPN